MKIGMVLARYGTDVIGGAENAARMLAEGLVDRFSWPVDVFTTCATSAHTWQDVHSPGTESVNGVSVHRFASVRGRSPDYNLYSGKLFAAPEEVSPTQAQRWADLQGPVCPDALAAARDSDADLLVYYPYLFYPTIRGVPQTPDRAVLHPAAHDEAPLRLGLFREVFASARALVFQTRAERDLVQGLYPVAAKPQLLLGLGVERAAGDRAVARELLGIGDRPFVLCLGRVEDGKGSNALARSFALYKDRHRSPLALVFAGPIADPQPGHPDIVFTGAVDEAVKWGLLEEAIALLSPSAMESFSLVVMEAWSAGIPVAVNADCLPTVEHCRASGGGMWFRGYAGLEVVLERLESAPALRARLADAGRSYVESNFSWPVLLDRYRAFLERLTHVATAAEASSSASPGESP